MKLQEYLARESLSPSQFAQRLNRPASTITRLLHGDRTPGFDLIRAIAEATNGEVAPNDFLEPQVQPRQKQARPSKKRTAA